MDDKTEFVKNMYCFLEDEHGWDDESLAYVLDEASEHLNYREMDKLRNLLIVRLLSKSYPSFMDAYMRQFVDHGIDIRNEDVI